MRDGEGTFEMLEAVMDPASSDVLLLMHLQNWLQQGLEGYLRIVRMWHEPQVLLRVPMH